MKPSIAILVFLATMLGWSSSANAIVVPGSTYGFDIKGSVSENEFLAIARFDGVTEGAMRGDQQVNITESETLQAVGSRINVLISSDTDLFPAADETGFFGIGVLDPFDFFSPVTLDDVRVFLRDLGGNVIFASDNLAYLAQQNMPWDGSFVSPNDTFGIEGIGGMGITSIEFNFYVSDFTGASPVPEPGSLLLFGLALLLLAALHRNRR